MKIMPIAVALKDRPLSFVTHGKIIVDRVNQAVGADNQIALNWTGQMLLDWLNALDPVVKRAIYNIEILNVGQSITYNAEVVDVTTYIEVAPESVTDYAKGTTRIGNYVQIALTSFIILAVCGVLAYYYLMNGTPEPPVVPPPPTPRGALDE